MDKTKPLILSILLLGGCAHSVEGIRQEPVHKTYSSAKAPNQVAQCLQERLSGLSAEIGSDYVSVSRENQFGSILINWFIQAAPHGSAIELRRTNSIAGGIDTAEGCF